MSKIWPILPTPPRERSADALVKSLMVIVGHVVSNHVSEMALAEEDEVPEAFALDGFDEALSVRIAVGTPHRNLDALNPLRIGGGRLVCCI